jgi:hypothetical protein
LILCLVHVLVSGAALGIFGYTTYGQLWYTQTNGVNVTNTTNFDRVLYAGGTISTWGLFQGASAVQLIRQEYGEGDSHCSMPLFFFLLWGSELFYIVTSVFVNIGGNYEQFVENLKAIGADGDGLTIATLVLFGIVILIMAFQFLYWVLCCGKSKND